MANNNRIPSRAFQAPTRNVLSEPHHDKQSWGPLLIQIQRPITFHQCDAFWQHTVGAGDQPGTPCVGSLSLAIGGRLADTVAISAIRIPVLFVTAGLELVPYACAVRLDIRVEATRCHGLQCL